MNEDLTRKFWTVISDGNPLAFRFTSKEEARQHCIALCQAKANRVCYILETIECLTTTTTNEIDITDFDEMIENVVIPLDETVIFGVSFVDEETGAYVDLSDCQIQLVVVPEMTSDDSEAIYTDTIQGTAELHEAEFQLTPPFTSTPLNAWYRVYLIEDGKSTLYQHGEFVIE